MLLWSFLYKSFTTHIPAFLSCICLGVASLDNRVWSCSVLVDSLSSLKYLYQVTLTQAVYKNYNCSTSSSTFGIVSCCKLSSLGSRLGEGDYHAGILLGAALGINSCRREKEWAGLDRGRSAVSVASADPRESPCLGASRGFHAATMAALFICLLF